MKIEDILSEDEIDFVINVLVSPGCKLHNTTKHIEDGSEYGTVNALWKKPEELGLIKCVGSRKWEPTDKIKLTVQLVE